MVNISLKDTFDLLTSSVPHLKTSELIEKCREALGTTNTKSHAKTSPDGF